MFLYAVFIVATIATVSNDLTMINWCTFLYIYLACMMLMYMATYTSNVLCQPTFTLICLSNSISYIDWFSMRKYRLSSFIVSMYTFYRTDAGAFLLVWFGRVSFHVSLLTTPIATVTILLVSKCVSTHTYLNASIRTRARIYPIIQYDVHLLHHVFIVYYIIRIRVITSERILLLD